MPVLAIAYANPSMPLPMMAFIRLKTEEAKEVPLVLGSAAGCTENTTKEMHGGGEV